MVIDRSSRVGELVRSVLGLVSVHTHVHDRPPGAHTSGASASVSLSQLSRSSVRPSVRPGGLSLPHEGFAVRPSGCVCLPPPRGVRAAVSWGLLVHVHERPPDAHISGVSPAQNGSSAHRPSSASHPTKRSRRFIRSAQVMVKTGRLQDLTTDRPTDPLLIASATAGLWGLSAQVACLPACLPPRALRFPAGSRVCRRPGPHCRGRTRFPAPPKRRCTACLSHVDASCASPWTAHVGRAADGRNNQHGLLRRRLQADRAP